MTENDLGRTRSPTLAARRGPMNPLAIPSLSKSGVLGFETLRAKSRTKNSQAASPSRRTGPT